MMKYCQFVKCGVTMEDSHPELVKNTKEVCMASSQEGIYHYLLDKKLF